MSNFEHGPYIWHSWIAKLTAEIFWGVQESVADPFKTYIMIFWNDPKSFTPNVKVYLNWLENSPIPDIEDKTIATETNNSNNAIDNRNQ